MREKIHSVIRESLAAAKLTYPGMHDDLVRLFDKHDDFILTLKSRGSYGVDILIDQNY